MDGEMAAIEFFGIEPNVDEHIEPLVRMERDGMSRGEDRLDF